MKRRLPAAALAAAALLSLPAGPAAAAKPTSRPAEPLKYLPVAPKLIKAFAKQAETWAAEAKKFSPSIHRIETPHFVIYSDWKRSNDRALAGICEKMYRAMCSQFGIGPDQNLWAGKCPVYIFWAGKNYRKFTTEVDQRNMDKAAGYCTWNSSGFVYIVMNRVKQKGMSTARAKTRFYEVLVHEATHGFLARYISNRSIPSWLNEGLADYIAATLVPRCSATRKHRDAAKEAVKEGKSIGHVFRQVGLNSFDYGIAQSLVRYLIARNRKGIAKLVTLIKQGATEAEALKQVYKLDHDRLAKAWYKAVSRSLRRR